MNEWVNERYLYKSILSVCKKKRTAEKDGWRQDGGSFDPGDQCLKWKCSGINTIVNKYKLDKFLFPFNATCGYEFFLLIMERISIWVAAQSDLRQRSRPRECRVFSKIKLKWMSVSQQGANYHQHNLKYGETILKMISAIRSMRYMNKSYLETEFIQITEWSRGREIYLWNNKEDRVLEPRSHRLKRYCSKIPHGNACLTSPKPTFKSTAKEHSQCLLRRLTQWELGEFDELLLEANTI